MGFGWLKRRTLITIAILSILACTPQTPPSAPAPGGVSGDAAIVGGGGDAGDVVLRALFNSHDGLELIDAGYELDTLGVGTQLNEVGRSAVRGFLSANAQALMAQSRQIRVGVTEEIPPLKYEGREYPIQASIELAPGQAPGPITVAKSAITDAQSLITHELAHTLPGQASDFRAHPLFPGSPNAYQLFFDAIGRSAANHYKNTMPRFGYPDLTFGHGGNVELPLTIGAADVRYMDLAELSDHSMLVIGSAKGPTHTPILARIFENGTVDTGFGSSGFFQASDINGCWTRILVNSASVWIAGLSLNNGKVYPIVERFQASGGVDASFHGGSPLVLTGSSFDEFSQVLDGEEIYQAITPLPSGEAQIVTLINGAVYGFDQPHRLFVNTVSASGTILNSVQRQGFDPTLTSTTANQTTHAPRAVRTLPDGRFVIAWARLSSGGSGEALVATVFQSNGTPLRTFFPGSTSEQMLSYLADGRKSLWVNRDNLFLFGGSAFDSSTSAYAIVFRSRADGTNDTSFGNDGRFALRNPVDIRSLEIGWFPNGRVLGVYHEPAAVMGTGRIVFVGVTEHGTSDVDFGESGRLDYEVRGAYSNLSPIAPLSLARMFIHEDTRVSVLFIYAAASGSGPIAERRAVILRLNGMDTHASRFRNFRVRVPNSPYRKFVPNPPMRVVK